MRRLSPSQQETLRKRVMAAVRDGMSIAEAVRVFGVSRGSVRNWKARFDTGGPVGLDSGTPGRRVGEQTKLSASEAEALVGSIVDYEPDDLELGGKLWTRRKVCALAERCYFQAPHTKYVSSTIEFDCEVLRWSKFLPESVGRIVKERP